MSVVHTMTVELPGNGRQKSLCRLIGYLHASSGQIYVLGMHDTTPPLTCRQCGWLLSTPQYTTENRRGKIIWV